MNDGHVSEGMARIMDGVSLFTVAATLTAVLPPVAALLTIVWTVIRILETATVREWLGKPPVKGDD